MPEFVDVPTRAQFEALADRVAALEARGSRPEPAPAPSPQPQPAPEPAPAPKPAARPFFAAADWLWKPIPTNPVLDPVSGAVARDLAGGAHVLNVVAYGVTLKGPAGIDASTPRYDVAFAKQGSWGPDPFGSDRMPVPAGTQFASGGDKHYSVHDPTTNTIYSVWVASSGGRNAEWGAKVAAGGDGRETGGGSSTGSNLSRHAGVITEQEMVDGHIGHALFFSSSKVGSGFRYPAVKTDQSGAEPMQEGMRIQLDPGVDISGLPKAQRVIAKALQVYGAYCGDGGGATVAMLAEYTGPSVSQRYRDAGITGDYASLDAIPWGRVRVLRRWDGG